MTQPVQDLKVYLSRQNTEFITDAAWPNVHELDKPINYAIRRDGVWEIRKARAGTFIVQREKFANPLPGFPEESNKEIGISNFGKIPFQLLREGLAFFKAICDESKDEAYIQTFWDPNRQCYFNHVPGQRVSGASVQFERDTELEARCVLVLEMHSHNTMGAFFSGVDNADEKSDRFFGVVGKLNHHNPEMLFSFVCGGKRVGIACSDIFDDEPEVSFPGDWKSRITKYVVATTKNSYSYEGGFLEEERSTVGRRQYDQTSINDEIDRAINAARKEMGWEGDEANFFP